MLKIKWDHEILVSANLISSFISTGKNTALLINKFFVLKNNLIFIIVRKYLEKFGLKILL